MQIINIYLFTYNHTQESVIAKIPKHV